MTRSAPTYRFRLLLATAVLAVTACGGGGPNGSATVPPASRGQVWEVGGPEDRAAVPGAVVAFVNGLHVMVLDGDRVFAGMTEMTTTPGSDGSRSITLPSGLAAEFTQAGPDVQVRFSSGEAVNVRARAARAE